MSNPDRLRWDTRYREGFYNQPLPARHFLRENLIHLPTHGMVLDLAAGTGRNDGILLDRGLQVFAVDTSLEAAERAKRFYPRLQFILADLTCLDFPPASFDLILNFYYLQRGLWPFFKQWLKPGGLLIFETMAQDMRALRPDIHPNHLLNRGELLRAFSTWDILVYKEGWLPSERGYEKAIASLVARRPD